LSKIVVTGGSGKAGRACVKDLLAHGYEVFNVDRVAPAEKACPFILADLADFGQAIEALSSVDFGPHGVDGIVHLAAIPTPMLYTNSVTFANNTLSTYNVFEAARRLGIKNIVWASSETVLGLPFDVPPVYLPIDEEAPPRPESAYSLSKLLGEEMAKQFCRWDASLKIVGLRFSNIMEPKDYARFAGFDSDSEERKWNLWGYIDARDAAQAVRRALEAPIRGAEVFIIANAETVMLRSDSDLLAEVFPGVSVRKRDLGQNETLLSIEKAKRLLGYQPEHSWRNPADHE
jgi:nucleoside-diphosphate-sugar epimerase